VRVMQNDIFLDTFSTLGTNAMPMAFGEVYSALQTGVIDGAENNWPSFESTRHFEVAKFYSQTEHSLSPEVLVMSKRSWDKLSKEDQALVRAAAKESVAKMRELWDAAEKSAEAKVKAGGAQINNVEKQPFIDAMKPVYDRFVTDPKLKDMVSRIQAALDAEVGVIALFENPTIDGLARVLSERRMRFAAPAAAAVDDLAPSPHHLLSVMDELSDEELDRLLDAASDAVGP